MTSTPEIAPGIPVTLFILVGFILINGVMILKGKPARMFAGINVLLLAWAAIMWFWAMKRSGF